VLILVSDLHLRPGAATHLSRLAQFERFWTRIEQARLDEPATLCFVGDLVDLVRAPDWLAGEHRPYHEPGPALAGEVDALVARTLEAEKALFSAIRARVDAGALKVELVVGNHDRLLHHAPAARARLREAFGMAGGAAPFPSTLRFPRYGVLATHGHEVDQLCHDPDGGAPLSDMVAAELIVRFPLEIRRRLGFDHPRLDDIDDVRPVLAVPAWVKQLAESAERGEPGAGKKPRGLGREMAKAWQALVGEFLDNGHVRGWFKDHHRRFKLDFAGKMKLLLTLSTKRSLRTDSSLHLLNDAFFKFFDVRFAKAALEALERPENRGLRYVVNGHTHFAAMTPLGLVNDRPACYFNLGTWRPVHQLGNLARGRPGFLAYDAMAYLAFFGERDALGREFEWWQGAAASRPHSVPGA
jgi:UDP-2,3-diacylglucosamine pyrophosphatase LpxH